MLTDVDAGPSIVLWTQAREDVPAQTALGALIQCLRDRGWPTRLSFDHNIRGRVGYSIRPAQLFAGWAG